LFTGTAAQLRDREQQARRIAQQVADLLNQVADLGMGPAMGNLTIPGADIRGAGGRWTAR